MNIVVLDEARSSVDFVNVSGEFEDVEEVLSANGYNLGFTKWMEFPDDFSIKYKDISSYNFSSSIRCSMKCRKLKFDDLKLIAFDVKSAYIALLKKAVMKCGGKDKAGYKYEIAGKTPVVTVIDKNTGEPYRASFTGVYVYPDESMELSVTNIKDEAVHFVSPVRLYTDDIKVILQFFN